MQLRRLIVAIAVSIVAALFPGTLVVWVAVL
jgi:hypothetical protein